MTRVEQLHRCVDVELIALRLEVGTIRPADFGAFVPLDAEPTEAVEDWLQGLGTIAIGVGVVDAEDELAAEALDEQPVEKSGADASDVEVSGGTGSEASADGHDDSCSCH